MLRGVFLEQFTLFAALMRAGLVRHSDHGPRRDLLGRVWYKLVFFLKASFPDFVRMPKVFTNAYVLLNRRVSHSAMKSLVVSRRGFPRPPTDPASADPICDHPRGAPKSRCSAQSMEATCPWDPGVFMLAGSPPRLTGGHLDP